jgi:hypothetical protein
LSEIPSTIDLIMQKTKGMSMSPEERESFHKEEMFKKAKGYRLKLLQNPSNAEETLSLLAQEPPEDRGLIDSFLWRILVEELPANQEILKYLDIMEMIAPGKLPILKEVRSAFKSGVKDRISDRKKILQKEQKRLAALGISGTAVVPKISKDTEDEGNFAAALDKFKADLCPPSPSLEVSPPHV